VSADTSAPPILGVMERDLRTTPLYREVEAFYRSVFEPGFGTVGWASDPVASPDGRWVAFRGERLDRLEGHEVGRICIVEADGGSWLAITDGPNDDADPQWSPDGTTLSFRSDRRALGVHQVYVLETGAPAEARLLASLPGAVEWHRWSPDGTRILAGVAGAAAEQADALGSGTIGGEDQLPPWIPEVESSDDADAERRSLWVIEVATGAARLIAADAHNVWEASWCGDDHAVAITSVGAGEDAWYRAGMSIIGLEGGTARPLLSSEVQLGWAEGSPAGSRIAVIEAICSDRVVVAGDLLLVHPDTGEATRIATPDVDVTRARWRDEDHLLVFGRRGMSSVAMEVDATTGDVVETWTSTEGIGGFHPSGAVFGDGFVAVVSSHRRAPAVVAVSGTEERILADLHHAGHDILMGAVGAREVVRWTAPDGLEIEGLLTIPHGDPPFPLVLHVHGGPIGATSDDLPGPGRALLLSRGFAILDPDPRGSTGRGRAFAVAVVKDMGGLDLLDDLAGVDAVVAAGVADPDRLVLTGGSYGGFMAAWIPTQDRRFKASVAISPVTDWWSERFDSSLGVWVGDYLGGEPQEVAAEYSARSPVLHVADVTTPVLLTAGRHDRATPVGQAVEFYRALRERGVPAEVVKYPQEGHGVGDFPAVLDLTTRTIAWFERFLPPRSDADATSAAP
jgi:dipeptidyl aminopeptidase/acylaminoacyl peptidase